MGVDCLICHNTDKTGIVGLSFHRIPNDKFMRAVWMDILGNPTLRWSSRVCSLHFTRDSYAGEGQRLKKTSVPNLNLHPKKKKKKKKVSLEGSVIKTSTSDEIVLDSGAELTEPVNSAEINSAMNAGKEAQDPCFTGENTKSNDDNDMFASLDPFMVSNSTESPLDNSSLKPLKIIPNIKTPVVIPSSKLSVADTIIEPPTFTPLSNSPLVNMGIPVVTTSIGTATTSINACIVTSVLPNLNVSNPVVNRGTETPSHIQVQPLLQNSPHLCTTPTVSESIGASEVIKTTCVEIPVVASSTNNPIVSTNTKTLTLISSTVTTNLRTPTVTTNLGPPTVTSNLRTPTISSNLETPPLTTSTMTSTVATNVGSSTVTTGNPVVMANSESSVSANVTSGNNVPTPTDISKKQVVSKASKSVKASKSIEKPITLNSSPKPTKECETLFPGRTSYWAPEDFGLKRHPCLARYDTCCYPPPPNQTPPLKMTKLSEDVVPHDIKMAVQRLKSQNTEKTTPTPANSQVANKKVLSETDTNVTAKQAKNTINSVAGPTEEESTSKGLDSNVGVVENTTMDQDDHHDDELDGDPSSNVVLIVEEPKSGKSDVQNSNIQNTELPKFTLPNPDTETTVIVYETEDGETCATNISDIIEEYTEIIKKLAQDISLLKKSILSQDVCIRNLLDRRKISPNIAQLLISNLYSNLEKNDELIKM